MIMFTIRLLRLIPSVITYGDDPPPPPPPADPPVTPPDGDRKFTQDDVNRFLAEDRRKTKDSKEKLIQELETLKKSSGLSQKEKETLTARIEELQSQVMSKEQLLEKERNKLNSEHQLSLKTEREEKEQWKSRYTDATIKRTIVDVATRLEAFAPEQIVALLVGNTRLVE